MKKFFNLSFFKGEKVISERVLDGVEMVSDLSGRLSTGHLSNLPKPLFSSLAPEPLLMGLGLLAIAVLNVDSLQAVPLESLRAPMTAMKSEVWSYMYVIKVAAAVMGGVMSVVQQNLMPLGIGGGIAAGIHFFDGVIGDGSAALISF